MKAPTLLKSMNKWLKDLPAMIICSIVAFPLAWAIVAGSVFSIVYIIDFIVHHFSL